MAIAEEADDGAGDDETATDDAGREPTDETERAAETDTAADDRYTRKKCVLITGCSSGIGHAAAQAFLQKDWLVVATARSVDDIAGLEELGCTTLELDVTNPGQVAEVVERTVEIGGAIDCLVNNAGYGQMGPIEDVSTVDLHRQFDVNVYGPHRLTRAALPHMRAQSDGRIINLSSVAGRVSFPGYGAYSGSKHALEAMTDALRAEVEEFGIEVVLIEPGPVETEFTNRAVEELPQSRRTPAYEALYEIYEDAQLLGGGGEGGPFTSTPAEVAAAIVESATRSDPPARYPVGPLGQVGVYARFLPDRLQDVVYGVVRKLV
jgi:NAD(P)-dependent dehydrogenase (short-subunit alcohol dehydrogenase family)